MKKLRSLIFSLALILSNLLGASPVFASANDFYFKKFNVDYYLKQQKDGSSEMAVEETLDAVFPSYNQNHGIERTIPFLNQNDTNLTTESTTSLDITVTRNGNPEPFTIKTYDDYFRVRIGDPDGYVHGDNRYVLKYKFINVITEFDASSYATEAYQELYWDSNGTGWSQRFDEVNVNLHMDNNIYKNLKTDKTISKNATYKNKSLIHENNETKEKIAAWCYVGRYGASNQNRCKITDLSDGINFNATGLKSGENLTFVTNFNDETFVVPKNDYIKEQYIKDATVDYYLSKDENGHAKVHVVEKLQVLFPTRNIDREFTRKIPYVNNAKIGYITKSQEHLNASVKMDGKAIEVSDFTDTNNRGFFYVSTKEDGYLHGEHNFILEYDYQDVIEFYNGVQYIKLTPIYQYYYDIDKITATIHFDNGLISELNEKKPLYCEAGESKITSDKINCDYIKLDDKVVFTTYELDGSDSFHISATFKDSTFVLPEPNRNYVYVHIFVAVVTIATIAFIFFFRSAYKKVGEKIRFLKNTPVVPQYTPLKDLTVGQASEAYLRHTKNPRVATMLELIVNKKLELIRGEKKTFGGYKWSGKVTDLSGLTKEQTDILRILNDGDTPAVGAKFEIKKHSYSSSLDSAFRSYDRHIKGTLEASGYLDTAYKDSVKPAAHYVGKVFAYIIAFNVLVIGSFIFVGYYRKLTNFTPFSVYEGKFLFPYTIIIAFLTFLIIPILSGYIAKYKIRTEKALEVTRYLDGLKLYIKMAEAERIKFLQSVENVDTSEEGIVKLNEKLLPYAALFGLEKSWMKELEKYYELHNEATPDWYTTGFNYSVMHSIAYVATSRPIDTSSSSGGWSSGGGFSSSSSSSGGGGGGFSGGGGGGGGGGGW